MTNEDKLSEQQFSDLSTKVEEEIVKKYKKRFIGTIVGLSLISAALLFFGWSNLVDSVTDKVADKIMKKIANEEFKQDIIKKVSESISSESNDTLTHIAKNKAKSDKILLNIRREHEEVLDAANHEFWRTISVLQKVRKKYTEKGYK